MRERLRAEKCPAVWDGDSTLMCTLHKDSLMPMPQLHFTKVNAAPSALWPFALGGIQRSGGSPEMAAYCTECRAVLRIRAPQQVLRSASSVIKNTADVQIVCWERPHGTTTRDDPRVPVCALGRLHAP